MNILLLYTPREITPFREHVEPAQLERMARALEARGWRPAIAEYAPDELDRVIAAHSPDLVFNLAYGYVDRPRQISESQADVTRRLEERGLVLVGAGAEAQCLAQDKLLCGRCLDAHGIASPRLLDGVASGGPPGLAVRKPRYGACHRGILLVAPGEPLAPETDGGELLLQEYVDGPELTVSVITVNGRPRALPPIEIVFQEPEVPHVMVAGRFRWSIEIDLGDRFGLGELSERAFDILRMRDYARFDFRVAALGPVLLDANSLPNLHPSRSYLPRSAEALGLSYDDLIHHLASEAALRLG